MGVGELFGIEGWFVVFNYRYRNFVIYLVLMISKRISSYLKYLLFFVDFFVMLVLFRFFLVFLVCLYYYGKVK